MNLVVAAGLFAATAAFAMHGRFVMAGLLLVAALAELFYGAPAASRRRR